MSSPDAIETRVLIVGAGPTGLALAIELGQRGVPCIVVERNARVGYAPRAKTTNVRTREHLRRWGIAKDLAAASPLGVGYPSNVLFVTRLAGEQLARFENAMYCSPEKSPLYSEHAQWIPQYTVEEVMRAHAATLASVQIRFNTELVSFEQDAQQVRAQVRGVNGGAEQVIRCDYLVGADGARSAVRELIHAQMQGTYGLSRNYNVVFRAPGLAEAHRHGPAIMYWQVNGDMPSLIGPMDSGDRWFFMPTDVKQGFKFEPSEAPALIRRATGIDLPYEVLSSDEWVASRLLADRYRDRRVFLAGDACHLHPPFGGYGMNMGVADGVDLGWKLAAVLQGWGGPGLLDSYAIERRPVHEFVMDEAVANHALLGNQLWQPGLEDAGAHGQQLRREIGSRIQTAKIREFKTLGVVLGYHYENSPVIVSDGTPAPVPDVYKFVPTARPGHLAPHAWREDGSSLYDHFGRGYTLVAGAGASLDGISRVREDAQREGMPLNVVAPADVDIDELYAAPLTLVRPDQHVAWRGASWPAAGAELWRVLGGRAAAPAAQTATA